MNRILLLILMTGIFSCREKTDIPENVLSPEKMEPVLWDVMKADELNLHYRLSDTTYDLDSSRIVLYESVFRKHKITKEQFSSSLEFYQQRPDKLRVILDSLEKKATRPKSKSLVSSYLLQRLNKFLPFHCVSLFLKI